MSCCRSTGVDFHLVCLVACSHSFCFTSAMRPAQINAHVGFDPVQNNTISPGALNASDFYVIAMGNNECVLLAN